MAQRAEEEKVSHFDETKDKEHEEKMQAYNDKADEMRANWNSEFDEFLSAQKGAVVEVAPTSNISSIKSVVNLGGGIAGANIDFSI